MTSRERISEAFADQIDPLREAVIEALDAFEFMRDHFVKVGECFTLPNGDCIGNRCKHDPRNQ